jgi:hypothetical protein
VSNCDSIAQRPENAVEQLLASGLLNPIEDFASRQTLSLDEISNAAKGSCVPEVLQIPQLNSILAHSLVDLRRLFPFTLFPFGISNF